VYLSGFTPETGQKILEAAGASSGAYTARALLDFLVQEQGKKLPAVDLGQMTVADLFPGKLGTGVKRKKWRGYA